jgi:phosphoenolpyruvate carboxylase
VTFTTPPPAQTATEKRGDILFLAKDAGLRQDVHDLGVIVGQLLDEQGGKALLDRVEQTRRAAIDARETSGGRPTTGGAAGPLSATEAETFIRAFSTCPGRNSAELVHRIRRRRAYLREGKHRQPGGFEDTLFELRDMGVTLAEIGAILADLSLEPVLTAHPTEPTRRTILRRQKDIVRRLTDMQNPSLSPREIAATWRISATTSPPSGRPMSTRRASALSPTSLTCAFLSNRDHLSRYPGTL